jgi:hypothetical protein
MASNQRPVTNETRMYSCTLYCQATSNTIVFQMPDLACGPTAVTGMGEVFRGLCKIDQCHVCDSADRSIAELRIPAT